MNTKLVKKVGRKNFSLSGLITELNALKEDTEYQIEQNVGPYSYQAGINDAITIIREHIAMQTHLRTSLKPENRYGRLNGRTA